MRKFLLAIVLVLALAGNALAGIFSVGGIDLQEMWTGTAGENIQAYELCYIGPDGKFYRASAASDATLPGLVLATTDIPANGVGKFLRKGKVINNAWNFTPGQQVHAGIAPGTLTHDYPGSRQFLQKIGVAIAPNQIDFDPNIILIEVAWLPGIGLGKNHAGVA